MTVREIAKNWNVSEYTVRDYCRKGRILGAVKKSGKWVIPDNYPRPYLSRKQKFSCASEKSAYVLQAIASGQYLDFRLLALSREEFEHYAEKLREAGLVREEASGYEPTQAGLDRCYELKRHRRQDLKDAASMVMSVAGPALALAQMLGL